MSEDYTRIKVILRIRPPHKQEQLWFKNQEYRPIMRPSDQTESPDTRVIIDSSNKSYDYDKIFRDDCTQKQIFREAALPTLDNVFKGYCGAVMAYGQTGTGKTHTMQGYDRSYEGEERGIIPRCAEWIFNRVEREKPNWKITITLMFVQIYLDKLQDLFKPDAPEVNIDPESERVELPGITQKEVRSTEEFMKAYFWGEQHRVTRATLMNPTSSRGHAALLVNVRLEPHDVSQATRVGKLVLVDLAGYERFAQTGITTGIAAEEAKKINASLLALGSVVNALAEKQKHIPYRNAKLTRLLKDCLGGTSKSTIVLTIGPCDKYKQETAGTLYFGWRAMAVKVNARIREEFDPTKYIQNLKDKLSEANQHLVKMVRFIKSMPGAYEKYVEKNGEPPQLAGIADDDDDEQGEILSALTRMPSRKMSRAATMAQLKAAETGVPAPQSLVSMPTEELLQDELVENPDAPVEVRRVQQTWNEELRAHQEQMKSELEMLRLRHIQDLEEARAAGVSEDVLMRLREEHEEELRLVQEQNKVLKEEILRQKQREEAKALLQSSMATMAAAEAQTGPASEVVKQDDARIKEMVTHLQETCSNKDEILVRLFDLICLREAEVKDYEINASAIAMATADDVVQHNSATLTEARREIEHLRGELSRKNAEIERMKKVSTTTSSVASTGQSSPPHPSHSTSIPSNTSTPSHTSHPTPVRETHSHSTHASTPPVPHPTPVVAHPSPQVPTGHRASVSHINIPTQPQPAPVPNQSRSKSQDFSSAGYSNLMPRGYPPTPQQPQPQVITRPYSGPPAINPQPHPINPRGAPFVPTGATAAPYQQTPYRGPPPYGPNTYAR